MKVNVCMLDYLRIGSWDQDLTYYWLSYVSEAARREGVAPVRSGWLQYKGVSGASMFAGVARQGEDRRMHTLLQVSGEAADRHAPAIRALADKGGGKATRVDVQVTVPLTGRDEWDPSAWAEHLREGEWGHRRPSVTVILGESGMHTLYVGSRSSSRYTRFYVKEDDAGNVYLRYEVEYKQERAQYVWSLAADRARLRGVLGGELDKLPLPRGFGVVDRIAEALAPGSPVPALAVGSGGNTWAWMHEAVTPALERLLASHEYGQQARALLQDWQDTADRLAR